MKTNWIDWHGGKRPVRKGTKVDVIFCNGHGNECAHPAEEYAWTNGRGNGDIVAFRIVYTADHEEAPQ